MDRTEDKMIRANALVCLSCILVLASGCSEARRDGGSHINREVSPGLADAGPKPAEPNLPSWMQKRHGFFPEWARPIPWTSRPKFMDHTDGGCPPELLAQAGKVLGGRVVEVWGGQTPWHPTKKLYVVAADSAKTGIFLEKDGAYIYVNARAELLAINDILRDYKFTQQDFNDTQRVESFLSEVVYLHYGGGHIPSSSSFLERSMGWAAPWLDGTEQDEDVLRELLCKDAQFTFEGATWTVVFNVIKPNGGVDEWRVVGEHDAQASSNQILSIEVMPLKPPGTFSYYR